MNLLIMRHGQAEPMQAKDEQRNLTEIGFSQAANAGQWLKQKVGEIDFAIVSPYIRARQTFETVSSEVNVLKHEVSADIIPEGNSDLVHDYVDCLLNNATQISHLLIVSHMPMVSYLVDSFIGSQKYISFPTSGIAQIEYCPRQNKGELLCFYEG